MTERSLPADRGPIPLQTSTVVKQTGKQPAESKINLGHLLTEIEF